MSNEIAAQVRVAMSYDPETGLFTNRITRSSRAKAGDVAGSLDGDGYVQIRFNGKNYKAHRLAFLYMTGKWPASLVDHRNTIRSDNRWENLRCADPAINSQNQRSARSDSQTGVLGVSVDARRGEFLAQISAKGKKRNLGRYATAAEAQAAYLSAKRQLHEGNTL